MDHFFTIDNLQALREIALRRTADQVNLKTERMREQNRGSEYCTDEHILVCLSPSPSNAKVIRAAARMVKAFKARFFSRICGQRQEQAAEQRGPHAASDE